MSFRLPAKVFSSASFRLTMGYATLFVVTTLAAVFAAGTIAILVFRAELKDEVVSELQALEVLSGQEGTRGLVEALEARAAERAETGLS